MPNVIYRGPADRQPITVTKEVAGAYLPGTFVEETATGLTQITTAIAKLPLILTNSEYLGQDIATAFASGDTGQAYELEPGQRYQVRVAAATYAYNQPLTVAASGRAAAVSTGTPVVAWFKSAAGAYSAGDLVDVVIANTYNAA